MARKILVVDDDPMVLRGVRRVLERAGWTVQTASRVDDALAWLENEPGGPQAAIVDYDLGDHDGLPVLRWMRDRAVSAARILMTGHDDLPLVVAAVNRGEASRVLRKPFHHTEILEVIESALDTVEKLARATTERMIEEAMGERAAIDACLADRRLHLALQPIVKADDAMDVVAWEALLRPTHERFSNPTQLLLAVERHHQVAELGDRVLELASERVRRLPAGTQLFVNLHPLQLGDPERLDLAARGLRPCAERVTFEITERSRLGDIGNWEESIRRLQDAGFSIAVDDLGAGYSALSILADLQPRYIKLDMSLVRAVDASPRKQRLVQLLVTFGDATGATVIAEGVETEAERDALVDCGVPLLQGYWVGPPVTAQ